MSIQDKNFFVGGKSSEIGKAVNGGRDNHKLPPKKSKLDEIYVAAQMEEKKKLLGGLKNGVDIIENKSYLCLPLTQRERDCLILVSMGLTSKEISKKLSISSRTVESYLHNAKEKLACKNLPHLISFCIKNNLID